MGKTNLAIPSKLAFDAIDALETAPKSTGKALLLKHLREERLTRGQAILAKCCDCMGFYVDGRVSCQLLACPLFSYMPYKNREVIESD